MRSIAFIIDHLRLIINVSSIAYHLTRNPGAMVKDKWSIDDQGSKKNGKCGAAHRILSFGITLEPRYIFRARSLDE